MDVVAARSARAEMVEVGLTTPPVATTLPSTRNKLGTSQLWFHLLTTDGSGSAPMRQVPIMCHAGVRYTPF